jgi:ssDNA-binding Zn-finger/Zn-ribbon topoisomerase 1
MNTNKNLEKDVPRIECPHCGHWNLHEECGTYTNMFPSCVKCKECTEVPNE